MRFLWTLPTREFSTAREFKMCIGKFFLSCFCRRFLTNLEGCTPRISPTLHLLRSFYFTIVYEILWQFPMQLEQWAKRTLLSRWNRGQLQRSPQLWGPWALAPLSLLLSHMDHPVWHSYSKPTGQAPSHLRTFAFIIPHLGLAPYTDFCTVFRLLLDHVSPPQRGLP